MHTPPPVPDVGSPASPGAARDASPRSQGKRIHRDSAYVLDFVRKQQDLNEALADDRKNEGRIPWLTGNASSR
jgi:hypothetical protein